MSSVNTLFVVPSLKRAGAEAQVVDLVNQMSDDTFRKFLLTFDPELDQLDRLALDRVSHGLLQRKSKLDFGLARDLARYMDDNEIDLVHCTLQYSLLVAAMALRHTHRRPNFLVSIHTTENRSWKEELFDRVLYRYLFRLCKRVLFVCNNQRNYWIQKYPELNSRSVVVHNGIDYDKYDPAGFRDEGPAYRLSLDIPDDAIVFSCVAGFRLEKGQQYLIEALSGMDSDKGYLVFAGEGPHRGELEALVRGTGIDERVRFLGNVGDVRPLLSISAAMVLPSTSVETFSIAMLEAMAMQAPVIGSDIGGMSEAVLPDETGYLVRPGNVDDLREALRKFLDDPGLSMRLGKNARKKVIQDFSVDRMARETEAVLHQVLVE